MVNISITYVDEGETLISVHQRQDTTPEAMISAAKLLFPTWIRIEVTLINTRKGD